MRPGEHPAGGPAQLTVGLLRPCILAFLAGTSEHGYELHHKLLAIGLECDPGTVYRALNTMEDEGLLRSTWERTAGGRSRRRYELSDTGIDMVDMYVAPVEQVLAVARAFLERRRTVGGAEGGVSADESGPDPPGNSLTATAPAHANGQNGLVGQSTGATAPGPARTTQSMHTRAR